MVGPSLIIESFALTRENVQKQRLIYKVRNNFAIGDKTVASRCWPFVIINKENHETFMVNNFYISWTFVKKIFQKNQN